MRDLVATATSNTQRLSTSNRAGDDGAQPAHRLDGQAQEIANLRQKLAAAQRERQELIQLFSHDFKNLVGGVTTFLQMLNDGFLTTDDPTFSELSGAATDAIWEFLEALEHLVDIYRIEDGTRPWVQAIFDVPSLLRKIHAEYSASAREREIEFQVEVGPYLIVEADRWLVERILKNIVANALKFVQPGGHITISARPLPSNTEVAISVCDDGPGISQAEQALIFDLFYRNAKRQASGRKGAGLGLTFSRKAAELMNGALRVESDGVPGHGSTFILVLPGGPLSKDT